MGFLDFTDADLIALTRQRRTERREALAAARPATIRFSRLDILACEAVEPPRSGVLGTEAGRRQVGAIRRKRRAKRFRLAAWEAGLRHCCYCGVYMTLRRCEPTSATTEHRTPLVLGGADDESNFAVTCYRCNDEKGELTEAEFLVVRGGGAFPIPWS